MYVAWLVLDVQVWTGANKNAVRQNICHGNSDKLEMTNNASTAGKDRRFKKIIHYSQDGANAFENDRMWELGNSSANLAAISGFYKDSTR